MNISKHVNTHGFQIDVNDLESFMARTEDEIAEVEGMAEGEMKAADCTKCTVHVNFSIEYDVPDKPHHPAG